MIPALVRLRCSSARILTRLAAPVCGLLLVLSVGLAAQPVEVIGEVRVHGNHTTPDEEILGLAGLTVGAAVSEESLEAAAERLRQSRRFANVEVRKRYRSIENPSDILIILLVDEIPAVSEEDLTPGPLKKVASLGMWLPILDYQEGYGFTYGARVSFVETLGPRSRISVPLTWGGERRLAVEVDRTFEHGPFTRVEAAATLTRRVNPHFEIGDTRRELHARAERAFTPWLRAGAGARLTNVRFGTADTTYTTPAVDLIVDTRIDPVFPRNAVHVSVRAEQLRFDTTPHVTRWSTDVRGYVGLWRSTVLAMRAISVNASGALPPYEQALLGGASSVRGYDFGYRAGDNLAAASAEIRMPITSPLNVGRFGVKAFFDTGSVYPTGAKLSDQHFDRGIGGGIFMSWAVLRAGLDVAWPVHAGTSKPQWHVGLGVTF